MIQILNCSSNSMNNLWSKTKLQRLSKKKKKNVRKIEGIIQNPQNPQNRNFPIAFLPDNHGYYPYSYPVSAVEIPR